MSSVSDSAADVVESHKERLDEERRQIVDAVQKVDGLLPIAHSLDEAAHKIEVDRTSSSKRGSFNLRFVAHFKPENTEQCVEAMRARDWDTASMAQTSYRVEQEDGSKKKFEGYRLKLKEEITY